MTTREKIIQKAGELFAAHGYDGVSVRDIAGASGVNVSAVSYHFGGKESLFREVIRDGLAGISERLERLAAGDATLRRRAELMLEAFFTFLLEQHSVSRIVFHEMAVGGKRLPDAAGAFWLKNSGLIKRLIRDGVKSGDIRAMDETLALFSLVSLPIYLAFAQPVVEIIRGDRGYSRTYVRKVARHAVGLLFDNGKCETPGQG
jgi:AcrR family transcriptional regulator